MIILNVYQQSVWNICFRLLISLLYRYLVKATYPHTPSTSFFFCRFCRKCKGHRKRCFSLSLYSSPARFGDDHLCPQVMEGPPEVRVLQGHPDVALVIRLSCSSHGR